MNFFVFGVVLFLFIGDVLIFILFVLILIMKFVGVNLFRLYLNKFDKGEV